MRRRQHNGLAALQRWGLALLSGLLLVAGCGDENAPQRVAAPPDPPMQVDSGLFDVTATLVFDACSSTLTFDDTYEIRIDGTEFSMGDEWSGTWDEKKCQGRAESERRETVIRFCTLTDFTSVNVTFLSEDEFFGSIIYFHNVSGTCGERVSCRSTWQISGARQ